MPTAITLEPGPTVYVVDKVYPLTPQPRSNWYPTGYGVHSESRGEPASIIIATDRRGIRYPRVRFAPHGRGAKGLYRWRRLVAVD